MWYSTVGFLVTLALGLLAALAAWPQAPRPRRGRSHIAGV
jgi:hypothetical protein